MYIILFAPLDNYISEEEWQIKLDKDSELTSGF